jgi:Rad3-related DNA helicase
MTEEERRDFLGMFESGRGPLLGFAVMGGVFGEAIDLKGGRLIGAIIVGVGLPQLGIERDLIRDYFDSDGFRHGSGFEFAYQYPGMNRVLQTAGRVIRSETDCGVVCLIDHRFNEASYQKLLPATWNPVRARNRQQLEQNLISFWRTTERTPGRSNASSS